MHLYVSARRSLNEARERRRSRSRLAPNRPTADRSGITDPICTRRVDPINLLALAGTEQQRMSDPTLCVVPGRLPAASVNGSMRRESRIKVSCRAERGFHLADRDSRDSRVNRRIVRQTLELASPTNAANAAAAAMRFAARRKAKRARARIMSFRRIIMRERSRRAHVNQCPLRAAADLIIR